MPKIEELERKLQNKENTIQLQVDLLDEYRVTIIKLEHQLNLLRARLRMVQEYINQLKEKENDHLDLQ